MLSLLIFLIILSVLVIIHELGHFGVAKYFGIRVDEFGLGYPPQAKKLFSWRGTDFTLNWLPFGGFVKIFGENPAESPITKSSDARERGQTLLQEIQPDSESFQYKNRGIQAAVLVAGVIGNFLFAAVLISICFVSGLSAPAGMSLPVENARTVLTTVLPGSPAAEAGLKSGDILLTLTRGVYTVPSDPNEILLPEEAANFIASSLEPVVFKVDRGGTISNKSVAPSNNILAEHPAVGISMEVVGTVKLPIHKAIYQGFKTTWQLTFATGEALGHFIVQGASGKADLSTVTGPVGLVGMVGDVRQLGLSPLLIFTALISINLCLINLLPFPALDGGRLLFVGLEAVTRRQIPPRIFNAVNAAGFALLIFLMILITIRDVRNIF